MASTVNVEKNDVYCNDAVYSIHADCGLLFIFQLIYTGVASFAPATALQAGNCNTQASVIINVCIAKHVFHL